MTCFRKRTWEVRQPPGFRGKLGEIPQCRSQRLLTIVPDPIELNGHGVEILGCSHALVQASSCKHAEKTSTPISLLTDGQTHTHSHRHTHRHKQTLLGMKGSNGANSLLYTATFKISYSLCTGMMGVHMTKPSRRHAKMLLKSRTAFIYHIYNDIYIYAPLILFMSSQGFAP